MVISEEGQYNLNNLKEISVTDSFMGLDIKTRNCQSIGKYDECKTMLHMENLRHECGCLPLSLRLSEEVKLDGLYTFSMQEQYFYRILCAVQTKNSSVAKVLHHQTQLFAWGISPYH